jgi:nucleoside-diphosphate-sugar epimerase
MLKTEPRYLLLGSGYTLTALARLFPQGDMLLTTRSEEKCAYFRQHGYLAEVLCIRSGGHLHDLLAAYPSLEVVVDSVPPLVTSEVRRALTNDDLPQNWLSQSLFGVKNVVAAVSSLKNIKRVIYLSTTGVFGVTDGSWVDELTPTNAETPRIIARVESENLYRTLGKEVVVVRPAAIYGPGRGILPALQAGRYRLIEGLRWSNRIHVQDLAGILKMLIEHPSLGLPSLLCAVDSEPTPSREVVEFFCEYHGLPLPQSLSLEEASKHGLHTMLSNQRISNRLVRERLGYCLLYPDYKAGVSAA